jgi:hypothetical protein
MNPEENLSMADDYYISQDSHATGLSLETVESKNAFFWEETPDYYQEKDAQQADSFLDKMYEVYGDWLNVMRGTMKVIERMADPDETPFHTLRAKVISMGLQPELNAYDYETPRRVLKMLSNVYKRRGICEGLIRTTRMFAKWDSFCAETGLGGCATGPKALSTWDGQSLTEEGSDYATVEGTLIFDGWKQWADNLWKHGFVIGALGDMACVEYNFIYTEDQYFSAALQLKEPLYTHRIEAVLSSKILRLSSTKNLRRGMTVQLTKKTNPNISEIVHIVDVSGTAVLLAERLQQVFDRNDYLSIGKSTLRTAYEGTGAIWESHDSGSYEEERLGLSLGTYNRMTYPHSIWIDNQWKDYQVLVGGTVYTILANTSEHLFVSGMLPVSGNFRLAKSFDGQNNPVLSYRLYNGNHSFLFNPAFNPALRGSRYDPFHRVWQGPGTTFMGAWGGADVGLYVTTPVVIHTGVTQNSNEEWIELDLTQPSLIDDQLEGMFINPNQNQIKLFRILGNSAHAVRIEGNPVGIVESGSTYFILKPRDAARYQVLLQRFRGPEREFANMDIDVRLFFLNVDTVLEEEPPLEA